MFETLLKKIARCLDKAKIPYMVIGGQAVLLYGEPRITRDIDITLGIHVDEIFKIKEVVKQLKLKFLVENPDKFAKDTMVLPLADSKTEIRVDFIFSFSPYERQAIERANSVKMDKISVKFASVEDLIIHKVIAGRARDLDDIRSILTKNPKQDGRYIAKWLKDFDRFMNEDFLKKFKTIEKEVSGALKKA